MYLQTVEQRHTLDQLFAGGLDVALKPRSGVKGGTFESGLGPDTFARSIDPGVVVEIVLPRFGFEDLLAATTLAGLVLSGCLALRAAK